jgi:hypothetical protein
LLGPHSGRVFQPTHLVALIICTGAETDGKFPRTILQTKPKQNKTELGKERESGGTTCGTTATVTTADRRRKKCYLRHFKSAVPGSKQNYVPELAKSDLPKLELKVFID